MDYFESISTLNQGNKRFLYVTLVDTYEWKNSKEYKCL